MKAELLRGLFLVQVGQNGHGGGRVDRAIAAFNVADDAVFINDDVGAQGPLVGVAVSVIVFQDSVGGEHFAVHVAEKGKLDVDLLGEGRVRRGTVHTHAKNLRVASVDLAR